MFDDGLGFDAFGGSHLQRVDDVAVLERPRFVKTAAQSLAKWQAGVDAAGGANGSWITNLEQTNKPIAQAAVNQKAVMVQRFTAAVNNLKWETNLLAVGDAGIKRAAAAKEQNYVTGTGAGSQGAVKMGQFLNRLIPYITANLPQIEAMPKGTLAAGKARMNAWADIMAAGAGSFG